MDPSTVTRDDMREDLIGFLMGALDEPETLRVKAALENPRDGEKLRHDLEVLKRAIAPLEKDQHVEAVPEGLADRTLSYIQSHPVEVPAQISRGSDSSTPVVNSRAWIDRVFIAATALAAAVLVAPLLLNSLSDARDLRVERNLQKISGALQGYAESKRFYPTPPDSGPLSRAGLYAPTLVSEHRLKADDGTVLVPGARRGQLEEFRIPTLEELQSAIGGPGFDKLINTMGGDFGYTLGYRNDDGSLMPNLNQRREHHPIMADAPDAGCEKSSNHPGGLHYILYEDGHVSQVFLDKLHDDGDHLYRNDDGETAAAEHPEDAVIGDSHHQP